MAAHINRMVKPKSSTKRSKARRRRPGRVRPTRGPIRRPATGSSTRPTPSSSARARRASRTQEIADEAGVNKALVHYYFGTKAALADAIFERALGRSSPGSSGSWPIRSAPSRRRCPPSSGSRSPSTPRAPTSPATWCRSCTASRTASPASWRRAGQDPAGRAAPAAARGRRGRQAAPDQRRAVRRQHDGAADLPVRHPARARASCSRSTRPDGAAFLEERRRILPELHPRRASAMIRALRPRRRRARARSGPSAAAQDTLQRRAAAGGGPAQRSARAQRALLRAATDLRLDVIGSDRLPAAHGQRAGVPSERRDRAQVRRSPAWPSPTCPRTAGRRRSTWSSGSTTVATSRAGGSWSRRATPNRRRGSTSPSTSSAPTSTPPSIPRSCSRSGSPSTRRWWAIWTRGSPPCGRGSRPARRWAGMRRRSKPSGCAPSCSGTRPGPPAARRSRRSPIWSGHPIDTIAVLVAAGRTEPELGAIRAPRPRAALRRRPEFEQFRALALRLDKEVEYVGTENRPRIFAFGQAGVGLPGLRPVPNHRRTRSGRPESSSSGGPGPGAPRAGRRTRYRLQQHDRRDRGAGAGPAAGPRTVVTDLEDIGRLKAALADDERIVTLRTEVERQARAQYDEGADHHAGLRRDAHRRAGGAAGPGAPPGRAGPGALALSHHPGAHPQPLRAIRHEQLTAVSRLRLVPGSRPLRPAGERARRLRQLRGDGGDRRRGSRRPAPRLRPRGGRPGRPGHAWSAWWTPIPLVLERQALVARRGRGGGPHPRGGLEHRGARGAAHHRRPRAGPHRAPAQAVGRDRAAGRPGRAGRAGGAGAAGRRPARPRPARSRRSRRSTRRSPRSTTSWRGAGSGARSAGTVLARYVEPGEFVQAGPAALQAGRRSTRSPSAPT